jgi:hypothetical protein
MSTDKDHIGDQIIQIEKDLGISHVHWSEMPWKIRLTFAEKIKNINFSCEVSVYKNPINQERTLENFLFNVLSGKDCISKVVIDGKKGGSYEEKIKRLLKKRGLRFVKIIFMDDRKEPCIRLADFIVGSFKSFLDAKRFDNTHIYSLLKHKIKILD